MQVRILVHTDVTKYLEFKGVDGSYVLNKGRVEKVPATDYEALRSPLLGLFEKRRLRSFLLCASIPKHRARPLRWLLSEAWAADQQADGHTVSKASFLWCPNMLKVSQHTMWRACYPSMSNLGLACINLAQSNTLVPSL